MYSYPSTIRFAITGTNTTYHIYPTPFIPIYTYPLIYTAYTPIHAYYSIITLFHNVRIIRVHIS
nr:MAG TPA: hypothetical protein [Caudoviricetes sp.]